MTKFIDARFVVLQTYIKELQHWRGFARSRIRDCLEKKKHCFEIILAQYAYECYTFLQLPVKTMHESANNEPFRAICKRLPHTHGLYYWDHFS